MIVTTPFLIFAQLSGSALALPNHLLLTFWCKSDYFPQVNKLQTKTMNALIVIDVHAKDKLTKSRHVSQPDS